MGRVDTHDRDPERARQRRIGVAFGDMAPGLDIARTAVAVLHPPKTKNAPAECDSAGAAIPA